MTIQLDKLLRPLTADEYAALKASIETHGQLTALAYDQHGALLDGHHRERCLTELGVPTSKWKKEIVTLPDEDARVAFVLSVNVHRRQMTKGDRKAAAKYLYGVGWTMTRIAKAWNVTQQQISLDLSDLQGTCNSKPRPKTATNPKGAGRPKGNGKKPRQRKTPEAASQTAATLVLDQGKTLEQAAAATGVGSVQVVKTAIAREEGRREAAIEAAFSPDDLPKSWREKYEILERKLYREVDARVAQQAQERSRKFIDEVWTPSHQKYIDDAKVILESRRGVMPRALFRKILACLHPDRSMGDKALSDAFTAFEKLELQLCSEREMPTKSPVLPASMDAFVRATKPRAKGKANVTRR